MDYSIRAFKDWDFNEVVTLWIDTDITNPQRADTLPSIQKSLTHGGHLLIMEEKETKEIIGTSWLTNDSRRLYLHHFCIKTKHQGKGLSKPLLKASLDIAKEKNMQVKLEVHSLNKRAIKLYKQAGFSSLGDYQILIIRKHN